MLRIPGQKTASALAKRLSILPAILPAILLVSACSRERLVVLFPAGDVAVQQRNLIAFATVLMLVVVIPVIVMTVVFSRKYSARNADHEYAPNFDHSTGLELAIWSIPLLIVTILGAVTWSSTHLLDPFRPLDRIAPGKPLPAGTKHLEIQVVAMDWKWLFIYPEQGIATVNELALPVNVPVRFSMTSTSQFNTFYAPTLAGMIYVMPGMDSKLHAVLNEPVESFGYSGNYTGRGYSDMRFSLRGLEPAHFNQWVAQVKGSGGRLQPASYLLLEKPSEKVPPMRFGGVAPGLYHRILNRCVQTGQTCIADVMMHDRIRTGKAVPQSRTAPPPPHGGKPVPALELAPEDKGSGPNVTKPPHSGGPPGEAAPGDKRNRDMSNEMPPPSRQHPTHPLTPPGTPARALADASIR